MAYYDYEVDKIPDDHIKFINDLLPYYIDEQRKIIFVHGGFNMGKGFEKSEEDDFIWDRDIIQRFAQYDLPVKIYKNYMFIVGHTPVKLLTFYGSNGNEYKPFMRKDRIIDLDTSAGYGGPLTIMDCDTFEYWQA